MISVTFQVSWCLHHLFVPSSELRGIPGHKGRRQRQIIVLISQGQLVPDIRSKTQSRTSSVTGGGTDLNRDHCWERLETLSRHFVSQVANADTTHLSDPTTVIKEGLWLSVNVNPSFRRVRGQRQREHCCSIRSFYQSNMMTGSEHVIVQKIRFVRGVRRAIFLRRIVLAGVQHNTTASAESKQGMTFRVSRRSSINMDGVTIPLANMNSHYLIRAMHNCCMNETGIGSRQFHPIRQELQWQRVCPSF